MSQQQIKKSDFVRWNAASLYIPPLNDLENVLQKGLSSHFKKCKVNVVKCPNLSLWGNIASNANRL